MKNKILITCIIFILAGCVTTPPTPITEPIETPVVIDRVWFRPTIDKPGFFVMTDTGVLAINNDSLTFRGDEENLKIHFNEIIYVSYGKLGSDFINNWIIIQYREETSLKFALFSAGKALGWAGGSGRIYSTIKYIVEDKKITTIKFKLSCRSYPGANCVP